jgi:predicted nucleic acid-binding protein
LIVLDASAALEVLARGRAATGIERRLFADGEITHVPALIDLEIAQVLRRYVSAGQMAAAQGAAALDVWRAVPVRRHGHELLLPRIWSLRADLTAYDAAYVALAEALDAPLLTLDVKLARAPGHRARIEVMANL